MKLKVEVPINGSKESIWKIITDIHHSANHIQAIEKIEILEENDKQFV